VWIHPDEQLLVALCARQQTAHRRARLRQRTQVEYTLTHVGRCQGDHARLLGANARTRSACAEWRSFMTCTSSPPSPTSPLNSLKRNVVWSYAIVGIMPLR